MEFFRLASIYLVQKIASAALQRMALGRISTSGNPSLVVWTSLPTSKVILVVEAANIAEVFWKLVYPNTLTTENQKENIMLIYCSITLALASVMYMILGILLKCKFSYNGFYFPLCSFERYPELIGYFLFQTFTRLSVLNVYTNIISCVIIWYVVLNAIIQEETSLALKHNEEYIKFWNTAPSAVILLDGALELIFQLKGFSSTLQRSRVSILKSWPALCNC